MSEFDKLSALLENNERLIKEMNEECLSLPSDNSSWFYLLPDNSERVSNMSIDEETDLIQVYAKIIPKPSKARCSASEELHDDNINNNDENEPEIPFSSQRSYIDLINSDYEQVENSCKSLRLRELSNQELVDFCSFFGSLEEEIPILNSSLIFKEAIFYKVREVNLNQKMPSSLQICIKNLTSKYSDSILNGVFVPLMSENVIGVSQAEILCHILSVLPEVALGIALKAMSSSVIVAESIIPMLEAIINRNVRYDNEILTTVLKLIQRVNDKYETNVKLGKLLINVLNSFHDQIDKTQVEILSNIVKQHKSFLKKAALSKLNLITNKIT